MNKSEILSKDGVPWEDMSREEVANIILWMVDMKINNTILKIWDLIGEAIRRDLFEMGENGIIPKGVLLKSNNPESEKEA